MAESSTSEQLPESPETKYAWRQHGHAPPKRSATERVADFLQIHGLFDEATAREQAARCIQCPEPACVAGCPLGISIPGWLRLTAEGRFLEAASLLHSGSSMTEICAEVCPSDRLCEGVCVLNGRTEPVSIGAIERFLNEYALSHGGTDEGAAPPNGFKVAVVGSGPGGLTCADELVQRGYTVTVLDAEPVPGGLLVNGFPAFRLERSIVQRRIDLLKRRGVEFKLGVALGRDMSLRQLRASHDAVFLGLDARSARRLEVPGADLRGVVQALPFIIQKNTRVPLDLPDLDVRGRRIAVLGAGDTALDCVRTGLRCGASEALCVYRRGEAEMPCSRHEYEDALEEGVKFRFEAAPVAVLGTSEGAVRGLRFLKTVASDQVEYGRRVYLPQPGTETEIETDWLFLALGFDPVPFHRWEESRDAALNAWGGLVVDSNQMTTMRGVFAGGDLVRGPGLVIDTVRDARQAARGIHEYLSAKDLGGGRVS